MINPTQEYRDWRASARGHLEGLKAVGHKDDPSRGKRNNCGWAGTGAGLGAGDEQMTIVRSGINWNTGVGTWRTRSPTDRFVCEAKKPAEEFHAGPTHQRQHAGKVSFLACLLIYDIIASR